nr:hypothetical protein Cry52Nrm2_p105 [Cryptomonas curvata]|mmetsp:Transcript_6197/g.13662  ORF Transcript_6197/g.13662 Transcript_6197/m.13662 type:complete len:86 (-) Transcript_6197:479-736(-)
MSECTKVQSVLFPIKKIKNFIQKNEKIGKITSTAPAMISRVLELIIIDIINEAAILMEKKKSGKIRKRFIILATDKKKRFKRFYS